jgi:glycosyltransferase involved in cell wall biosynthesis
MDILEISEMKILCVIDSLGSGGAQRQMVNLACGLKAKGHDVEMFVYFPQFKFFRSDVDACSIVVHEVDKGLGFSFKPLWRLINLLCTGRYEFIISFLTMPNIYCELARLTNPATRLIVSERSSSALDGNPLGALVRRILHLIANCVVTNSETHGNWLRRYPWLRKKTIIIYNGYSTVPLEQHHLNQCKRESKYLVIGRVDAGKNGLLLVMALILFEQKHGRCPIISWAGRREVADGSNAYLEKIETLLMQHPAVSTNWHWLGERNDVPALLASHDALIHPSLYEGLPNVICEALFAGRPVIASNICDHPLLVEDGLRGFLFDPLSAESICEAIERFESLSDINKTEMSINARSYAEKYLTIDRMVSAYEALLR